jgi:hypothetical protein
MTSDAHSAAQRPTDARPMHTPGRCKINLGPLVTEVTEGADQILVGAVDPRHGAGDQWASTQAL